MPEKRTTDRLLLRQINSGDVSAIPQSWFDLARFLTRVTRPDTLKVAFAFSASTFARLCKITAQHAVTLNARVMGVISATDVPGHCYGTPYRGQGSATKAKEANAANPFNTLDAHAPRTGHVSSNPASQHVLRKIKFGTYDTKKTLPNINRQETELILARLTRAGWKGRAA